MMVVLEWILRSNDGVVSGVSTMHNKRAAVKELNLGGM
jgi:hypothetical protein